MKKIFAVLSVLMITTFAVFAQADLQPLAVVKLNKNESITLKQLRVRCDYFSKQVGRTLTIDEKKQVLDTLIEEALVVQAATKAGISIPDSTVDQYFALRSRWKRIRCTIGSQRILRGEQQEIRHESRPPL